MRKEFFLPALALTGGVAGFFLRRWELATAFEPGTNLPLSGVPATWALLVLSLLMAGVLLLLCSGLHFSFPDGYDQAFRCHNPLYATFTIAAGFLLSVGGILKLMDLPSAFQAHQAYQESIFRVLVSALPKLLLAFFCLAGGVCIVLTAKNNYRAEGRGTRSIRVLIPAFTCCLWLIAAYQARAADPVLIDYVYQLFAIIAILLALYSMASFSFEKAKVTRAIYFSLLGVYLSTVTLADAHTLDSLLLFAFAIVYLTTSAAVLLANDCRLLTQWKAELPPEGGIH